MRERERGGREGGEKERETEEYCKEAKPKPYLKHLHNIQTQKAVSTLDQSGLSDNLTKEQETEIYLHLRVTQRKPRTISSCINASQALSLLARPQSSKLVIWPPQKVTIPGHKRRFLLRKFTPEKT